MTRSRQRVYAFGRGLCLAFATAVLFVAGNPIPGAGNARLATAQVARPEGAEDYSQNVFLPPDRPTLRKLSQSRLLIEEGRYGEAVRFLGDILEEPEDYLFSPKGSSPVFRSLKSEAERLIGRLPRRGRDLYELQYGAQAQRMLTDALASGDVARLAEVSRRFFHARSGYQATFLLGLHHFDHGRPLAGAMVLQRLREVDPPVEELEPGLSLSLASCWLQAGMPERARESLASLRQRDPALRVTVAGREVPLFADDSEAIDWLAGLIGAWSAPEREIPDDWLMFRGNSSRNASTNGGSPLLNMRWRVLATDDPLTESILTQYRNIFSERGLPAVPILHPLAVGDVVLMRTLRNLLAVDFATGKRLWEVPFEEPVELASAENVQQLQAALALGAGQRMWGDLTYGTLSSDGRHVFSVEDLGLESGDDSSAVQRINVQGMGIQGRVVIRIRNPRAVINGTSLCNRLTAHDIRTGKLTWELGGTDGPRALRQAETFFLGPPLPLMGRLYVLAEIKGEVRLLALDSATGDLCWTQQLSLIERGVLETPQRRWTGVSPSYADGVLVCPTSTGAVVGVELATRSLLWGYCYHQDQNNAYNNGLPFVLVGPSADRWIDGAVAIRDGRVFVTPQDSNRLYCLNLIDGELLWKSQRKNDLYVACVDREKVVLVGRDAVRALRLKDGEPAWGGRVVSLPEGSTPSGRGFLSGDQYFLPLGSAEVAAIDLAAGRIDNISKSRNGTIPGNLVCHKGIIVSQGIQGVDAYFQLDLASAEVGRRLKVNPNDAWALSLRGEILLNADRRSEAIASFRHAYDLTPDPRTRELLRDTLLDGLRSEFAAYRGRGEEIEPLLDDLSQRAVFLRLMASGLHGEGQWAEAFENYSKLVDLEPNRQPLDQVDDGLVVRRDR
ncbi:MAG: PQQ-binding-like beta-propeller repeat protein, partial [Planctomycetes bacterium]|nr:PQQ-binding-like beta-propeller repeat protein [Planctomycetota bacterium]MCG2685655.1 PQQ-binding-like beta-propeller repeat protein [Planctomycetales bacterium]